MGAGLALGSGATDRADSLNADGHTFIDVTGGALSEGGTITSFEIWSTGGLTTVSAGLFHQNSATSYTGYADSVEAIGNVAGGSKQTFSGLDMAAHAGDYLGVYAATGFIEADVSEGHSTYYSNAAQNWCGDTTARDYTEITDGIISIYATGFATPACTTQAVSSILLATAVGNGNVTDDGGGITERGICWNTTGTPTTADFTSHDHTSAEGAFTMNMTGLHPGIKYYVRAYCINPDGTVYGSEVNFMTYNVGIMMF